jgi:hypothetical protein
MRFEMRSTYSDDSSVYRALTKPRHCSARARGRALVGLLGLDADRFRRQHSPPQAATAGGGGDEQPHAHKAACVGGEPKARIARQLEAERAAAHVKLATAFGGDRGPRVAKGAVVRHERGVR